jgi:hypothetical protein
MPPDGTRRTLGLLAEALDDIEPTQEELAEVILRLPISVSEWAADIRRKIDAADEGYQDVRDGEPSTEGAMTDADGRVEQAVLLMATMAVAWWMVVPP